MRIFSKRLISLLIACCLIVPAFAVTGIVASAEDYETYVLCTMDEDSRPAGAATKYHSSSYVDLEDDDHGYVLSVANHADQYTYIKLSSGWADSVSGKTPVKMSIDLAVSSSSYTASIKKDSGLTMGSSTNTNYSLVNSVQVISGTTSIPSTWVTVSFDLTDTLRGYDYIGWKNYGSDNSGQSSSVYIDNITLYYESSADTEYTATFSGTAETVADISGTTITLPAAGTVSGKIFAGWSDGEKLYAAGDEYKLTADTAFTAMGIEFKTDEKASIRWSTDNAKRGLKFETQVSVADFDALKALGAVSAATVGTTAKSADGSIDLDISNDTSAQGTTAGWYAATDDYYVFYGSATEFGTDKLDTAITGQGYITVHYADAHTATFNSTSSCTRTMKAVANECLNDSTLTLTDAQKTVLKDVYGATVSE